MSRESMESASVSPPSSPEQNEPDLQITSTAPAVVEWNGDNDAIHVLSDPDPRSQNITFKMRHQHDTEDSSKPTAASFIIHIPVKLKGLNRDTQILVLIPPDRIASLDHDSLATAPDSKLGSRPVCRLTFHLHLPPDIVVPAEVPVTPLRAHRAATGQVLDVLPSLGRVTHLVLYLPANAFPKYKLAPLCAAIAEGHLEPTDRCDDLASLYNGSGGKVLKFGDPEDKPPSYNEVPPPAPMAPLPEATADASYHEKGRKRSRRDRDSSSSVEDGRGCSSQILTVLTAMRKQIAMQEDRMNEQSRRIDQLEREAAQYKSEMICAQEQAVELTRELVDAQEKIALLEGRVETIEQDELGRLDHDMCGLQEDVDNLQEHVEEISTRGLDSDAENRIINTVTERVTSDILDSGIEYNATVTFSRP